MLVLSRKYHESIIVGDDIRITVLGGSDHRVRIGIETPRGVPVFREELLIRMKATGREVPEPGEQPVDPDDQP
jgi:carbon storage regulator